MGDVAKRAGVSRMTVSYALRNDPRIAAGTRDRVVRAAAEVGYRVNPLVSALMAERRGRSPGAGLTTLGVLVRGVGRRPEDESNFIPGAQERAAERGYHLDFFHIDDEGMTGKKLTKILRARGIRGVLISRLGELMTLDLDWEHFSVVSQGYTLVQPEFHRVASDLYHGALLAVDQLRRFGYRRIGLAIPQRSSLFTDELWLAAYCVRQRMWPAEEQLPPLLFSGDGWEKQAKCWVTRHRPDAILHSHVDLESLFGTMNLRVPEDIGLAHLDLFSVGAVHGKGMAGIDQRWAAGGAALIDVLVARLHANDRGIPAVPRTVLVEGCWVPGRTVENRG